MRTLSRRMLLYVACAVVLHHALLWGVQRRLLFPGGFMSLGGAPRYPGLVTLEVEHEEGRAFGFLKLAATEAGSPGPSPLVVYAHGNAEIVSDWTFQLEPYTSRGFHFLAVEYRGFGTSEGTPTEAHLHRDIAALIDEAARVEGVDASRVIYHGRSVGGGVLGSLARQRPPSGLILESAFSSVHSMSSRYLAPPYLVRDPLDVHSTLTGSYGGPVLLLHSRVDEVIPFEQFERNRAAAESRGVGARTEVLIHETLGHNDTWLAEKPELLTRFALSVVW